MWKTTFLRVRLKILVNWPRSLEHSEWTPRFNFMILGSVTDLTYEALR